MVSYMTGNDVIYTSANIGNDFVTISIQKTDEANESENDNLMGIGQLFPLPTNMWK